MSDEEGGYHKPQCDMMVSWRFTVSKRDALLILKALGGRLSEDEVSQAADLCDRLTILRAAAASDQTWHLARAAEQAKGKNG